MEGEYMCVLSTLDVFDKVAGLPPGNQSFKAVFKIKITVVCVHRSPFIKETPSPLLKQVHRSAPHQQCLCFLFVCDEEIQQYR